eukprot:comp21664_c0_seq1/m.30471 comp21664_c0_seq1/g.30471  ORF comp21664_c0_seq1/g.30471 comp21664_c0_seq1/m.30471 type:complete len:368 (+) comp21664_c0_seq1:607-1710(+)
MARCASIRRGVPIVVGARETLLVVTAVLSNLHQRTVVPALSVGIARAWSDLPLVRVSAHGLSLARGGVGRFGLETLVEQVGVLFELALKVGLAVVDLVRRSDEGIPGEVEFCNVRQGGSGIQEAFKHRVDRVDILTCLDFSQSSALGKLPVVKVVAIKLVVFVVFHCGFTVSIVWAVEEGPSKFQRGLVDDKKASVDDGGAGAYSLCSACRVICNLLRGPALVGVLKSAVQHGGCGVVVVAKGAAPGQAEGVVGAGAHSVSVCAVARLRALETCVGIIPLAPVVVVALVARGTAACKRSQGARDFTNTVGDWHARQANGTVVNLHTGPLAGGPLRGGEPRRARTRALIHGPNHAHDADRRELPRPVV